MDVVQLIVDIFSVLKKLLCEALWTSVAIVHCTVIKSRTFDSLNQTSIYVLQELYILLLVSYGGCQILRKLDKHILHP